MPAVVPCHTAQVIALPIDIAVAAAVGIEPFPGPCMLGVSHQFTVGRSIGPLLPSSRSTPGLLVPFFYQTRDTLKLVAKVV